MKKNLHILFLLIIWGWGMSIIILSIHPILQYNNYAKKKQKAAFNVRQSPLLGRPEGYWDPVQEAAEAEEERPRRLSFHSCCTVTVIWARLRRSWEE